MTHTDITEALDTKMEEELETVMEEVLQRISDDGRRRRLRESAARVGNMADVGEEGEVVRKIRVKEEGLKLVVERTKEIMKEELRITWAACQAVDMKPKVEASVMFILEKHYHQAWASVFFGGIPIARQAQIGIMFTTFTQGLAKIWNTSPNLEKAIVSAKYFVGERMKAVMSNLTSNVVWGGVAIAGFFVAPVIASAVGVAGLSIGVTEIIASLEGLKIALKAASAASGILFSDLASEPVATLLMSYGLLLLGAIMYAHVHVRARGIADEQVSVEDYERLYEEFLLSEWAAKISALSERCTTSSTFHGNEERTEIMRFFNALCQSPIALLVT